MIDDNNAFLAIYSKDKYERIIDIVILLTISSYFINRQTIIVFISLERITKTC